MSLLKLNNSNITRERVPASEKLLKSLFEQKLEGYLCDVKLQIKDITVWGHACVLALYSSYFKACFKLKTNEQTNWEKHWCFQNPLVIDLAREFNDIDLCFICISKVIDFLYLREVIVIPDHINHFTRIVKFFNVVDLLPLCKKFCLDNNVPNPSDQIASKIGIEPKAISTKSILLENDHTYSSKIINCQQENCRVNSVTTQKKIICDNRLETSDEKIAKEIPPGSSLLKCKNLKNKVNNNDLTKNVDLKGNKFEENNSILRNSCSREQLNKDQSQKCQFLCCKLNLDNKSSSTLKDRKRRKMACEKCSFTSVSVKKMLKHLQNMNHVMNYCPICIINVNYISDMEEHLRDHNSLKPYICHICKKRNRFWEYHRLHFKVHCRNKQFHCSVCQKTFKNQKKLNSHLITHKQNLLCNNCNYLTNDINIFRSHTLKHHENNTAVSDLNKNVKQNDDLFLQSELKEFQCQICERRFTKKRNLSRHLQLKHFSVTEFSCSKCNYTTKRTDLLRTHMKKHHDYIPSIEEENHWKAMKTKFKRTAKKIDTKKTKKSDEIMGVLIPVSLVSTSNYSTFNAFAVKATTKHHVANKDIINNEEPSTVDNAADQIYISDSSTLNNQVNECMEDDSTIKKHINNFHSKSSNIPRDVVEVQGQHNVEGSTDNNLRNDVQKSELTDSLYRTPSELNGLHLLLDSDSSRTTVDHSSEVNEDIWLNESTGELLSGSNFLNVHVYDSLHNHLIKASSNQSSISDPIQRLIINENNSAFSLFDFGDDKDDFISNPQTPQASLMELDDTENIFPLNCLDNGFCSTWVLNETTGELNMVSFGIQTFKSCEKLDENARTFSSLDDDETALFLNEGTGDLSVIYFNPNKNDCNISNKVQNENFNHENLETLSEHSNDDEDDDLLNEEFLRVSADFMADGGNEKFLNELTGEFDIASFDNYHSQVQDSQIHVSESYLNEETGEICWNVLDDKLFTDPDMLNYDFDDSMNCDDFDKFSSKLNDLSSQFCLQNKNSDNWHTIGEACDTLLNEYTGELVKKT